MNRLISLIAISISLTACYYGPVLEPSESNQIRRAARTLNPVPIIGDQAYRAGEDYIGGALDSAITPLIFDDSEFAPDPNTGTYIDADNQLKQHRKVLEQQERELEELDDFWK